MRTTSLRAAWLIIGVQLLVRNSEMPAVFKCAGIMLVVTAVSRA